VRLGNKGAQNLYRKFGFRPVGVRKNYYAETKEDALVMWAEDVGGDEYLRLLQAIEVEVPGTTEVEDQPL
jgi:RimJ/RimL family protein N-acetyltransferase